MRQASGAGDGELRLELLGGARLSGAGISVERLERKTAAALAYVALEKDATRARVASLLWPDAEPATARNNLAQVIARVKKLAGRSVVSGKDALTLDRVGVDVAELELGVQRGQLQTQRRQVHEQLLAGYDLSDCAELSEWLDWRRDQLRRTLLRALELESRRLEAERDFAGAIERTEEALRLDRWAEVTYRRLMRLHIARGDRAQALEVFAECERVLDKELNTSPSTETVDLASRLRQESPSPAAPEDERAPSLRFDHPPFVGRARPWAIAERASEAGQIVFVSGEPGIGKTRFLLELAHAKGRYAVFEGRPGDGPVPFSTLARCLRQLLRAGSPTLPGWARLELSRILPELSLESAPMRSDTERLRLFEATFEMFRHALGDAQTLVFDDLQFCDAASVEAFDHLLGRFRQERATACAALVGFRRGELGGDVLSWVERTLESGHGARIELGGLEADAIWKLAETLSTDARLRAPDLERASLGNPLFISEILRSATRDGQRASRVPPRIERLLERRLERLSPPALRLARVAAILGSDLGVEVAARVMEQTPLDLDEPWAELEREQVLSNRRFVHDLMAETLERSLSRALHGYLHKRAAEELAAQKASPATIARHFLLAEDELGAAPFMVRAAEQLRTLSRLEEAADSFERAGDIFIEHGDVRSAFGAWFAVGRIMRAVDRGERFQRLVQRMTSRITNDAERARALVVRAFYDEARDDLEPAARHAREALELATALEHAIPRAEALRILFIALLRQGNLREAEVALYDFVEMCRASGQPEAEVAALWHGAELLAASDQHEKAIELCRNADAIVERIGQLGYVRVVMQGFAAYSALALGRTVEAEQILSSSASAVDTPPAFRLRVGLCQARLDMARGRLRAADERLGALLAAAVDWLWEARLRCWRGVLWCWLGAVTLGRNELLIVIDDERSDATIRVEAMLALARSSEGFLSEEHRVFIEQSGSPLQRLALLGLGPRRADEQELETAIQEARALAARGHDFLLSLALAEVLVNRGEHARSLELVESVWRSASAEPTVFPELARIAHARGRVIEAGGGDAGGAWADALAVALGADVPAERRESYERNNPIVFEIRRRAGHATDDA